MKNTELQPLKGHKISYYTETLAYTVYIEVQRNITAMIHTPAVSPLSWDGCLFLLQRRYSQTSQEHSCWVYIKAVTTSATHQLSLQPSVECIATLDC